MQILRKILPSALFITCVLAASCKKSFLDKKPSSAIVTPSTLDELEGLLQQYDIHNNATPCLPIMAGDEYSFVNYAGWQATTTATERNSYIWAKDIFQGEREVRDWNHPYTSIFYCNNVFEGLSTINITDENRKQWHLIFGWASFLRAYMFYDLVRNFSPAYDSQTSSTDLGVPLKLKPGVDEVLPRATLEETYQQIIADMNNALRSLVETGPAQDPNRPTKASGYALFARMYLSMRKYKEAEAYADSALAGYNTLIDYNTVDLTAMRPFDLRNAESLFTTTGVNWYTTTLTYAFNSSTKPDSNLVALYQPHDLRRNIYFDINLSTRNLHVKPGYNFNFYPYTGLATDELYLIKAECAARGNDVTTAMSVLNGLLINRYETGHFSPLAASSSQQALAMVLEERRKELVWRGLRWDDLKRLNKEGYNIELKRILNGETYTLPPNDPCYVFPIPDDEIALSGIEQNSR